MNAVTAIKAVTQAAQQPEAPPREIVPVPATAVKLTEFEGRSFTVYADDSIPVEDFANPKLWIHASQHTAFGKWHLRDRVWIEQTNRLTFCLVVDEGIDFTTLMVLQTWELPKQKSAMERSLKRGYSIRRGRPGQDPFIVYRDSDDSPMSSGQGLRSYEAAHRWAHDHPAIGPETNA